MGIVQEDMMVKVQDIFNLNKHGKDAKEISFCVIDSLGHKEYVSEVFSDTGYDFCFKMSLLEKIIRPISVDLSEAYEVFCENRNICRDSKVYVCYDYESYEVISIKFNIETNDIELYL